MTSRSRRYFANATYLERNDAGAEPASLIPEGIRNGRLAMAGGGKLASECHRAWLSSIGSGAV
jgi:hypothetical protein